MLQIPYVNCSKCNMRLIQQLCKETANFKNKSPQLSHNKYFLQAHFFIENNPTIFHYGGNKSLNLKSRKVPLYLIVSFFSNSLIVKSGRLALSKCFALIFGFSKVTYTIATSVIQEPIIFGDLHVNLVVLIGFSTTFAKVAINNLYLTKNF